jgi:hypothetical protein
MCPAPNSNQKQSSNSTVPQTTNPKRNKHSHGGKNAYMSKQQGNSTHTPKPNDQSRNAKRARWAKKSKPAPKSLAKRGPIYEYISKCCSLPASKPRCGLKEAVKDPESGKMKDKTKGLGHWRCSGCRKVCKVIPRKPQPKELITAASPVGATIIVGDMGAIEERVLGNIGANSCPDAVYPGPLTTPVLEVPIETPKA